MDEVYDFVGKVGYPVLVRPSYVLSGAAMNVCYNAEELETFLKPGGQSVERVSGGRVAVLAERQGDRIRRRGAQRRSGRIRDFGTCRIRRRPLRGTPRWYSRRRRSTSKPPAASRRSVARSPKSLNISGPFNIQFLAKNNDVKVIECNLRASRSLPVRVEGAETQLHRDRDADHARHFVRKTGQHEFRYRLDRREGVAVLVLAVAQCRPGARRGYVVDRRSGLHRRRFQRSAADVDDFGRVQYSEKRP